MQTEPAGTAVSAIDTPARLRDGPPLRLLVVEDNNLDADLLYARLRSDGYLAGLDWQRVRSIAEAQERLREAPTDCVLLDLGLPDTHGLSGLEALRALNVPVAIVVLTGYNDESTALAAMRAGAQDYVLKEQAEGRAVMRAVRHSIQRQHILERLNQEKKELDYEASHDPLTGLGNRRQFEQRLAQRVVKAGAGHFAVVLLDLNGFKPINDVFGHATGDALLKVIGQRLRAAIRPGDTAARLGGDEFVLLVELEHAVAPPALVERLRRDIEVPVELDGTTHRVSASIGVANGPADGDEPQVLLTLADARMYADKQARGGARR